MDIEAALYAILAVVVGLFADVVAFAPITRFIGGFVVLNAITAFVLTVILAVAVFGILAAALKLPKTLPILAVGVVVLTELWNIAAGVTYGQTVLFILMALAFGGYAFTQVKDAIK